jgi:transcriptional regulator with GAF, ATPase, and Fis domain
LLDQTRLALSETQNLYEISAGLNAAESTQDITNVVIDSMIKDGIYTASLWLVTPTSSGELLLDIATDWTRGSGNNQSGSESLSGSFELSDFPFFANLLLKSPKVTLISSPEEELGIREDENLAAVVNALNIKSIAFLPLLVGRRPIGLFSMAWQQTKVFDPADSQRFTAIAAQIATAIDSLRLLDQTQQALSETQALYQISARLNAAESTKDIVNSVVDTLQGQEVDGTRLWLAHSSGHTVQAIENTHSWFKNAEQDGLAENLKLDLADFPYMFELLNTSRELQLIPSISTDSKLIADSNLLESVRQSGYSSMAFLPLSVGSNLIGLFTIGWNVVRYFTELDHQYFTAVGAQIATTVESLRLLEDTKLRAAQLERLTEIETALSSAANENEILQAMASGFDFARGGLHYVDSNLQNIPNTVMSVAIHENNEFVKPEFLSKQGDISGFLASEVWLSKPNAVTVIPNMFEYPGITQKSKEISEKMEATTFCVVPLLSGRRWQGILTLSWAEAHELSSTESFLLENLREPLSAIVARHRSQLAAQKARQESEQLYNASSHLNRAASNINNIVTVVAALAKPVGVFQTVLAFTQTDRHGEPIGLEVSAIYKDTELERSVAVGDRFGQVLYKQIATFTNAHFMEGVTEEGVDENAELAAETKKLQDQLSSTAAGILPLTVGDEKVGFMFLLSDRPTIFDENSRRLFSSLAPQIAVAVQNSLLLDGAQTRANREQALRQISEKVRNTSDVESVMRTAVTEIGRVLGRKTFLYLKDNDDDTSTKANK